MAYRDAVEYIEKMNPAHVRAVGEECLRTKGIIRSALPTLTGLAGKVEWRSDARDLYERRLTETIDLAEGLHDGFDKAGTAIIDYAEAQERAKQRVAEGIAAESSLGNLIAPIADAKDIATGAPDNENGRFSTLGWAKEFRTYGELERTVTWTIGDPNSVQVSGGGGTDRNAPGEDRTDGRNSG
jgi:hypothetical protein